MKKWVQLISVILIFTWVSVGFASPSSGLSYVASQQTSTGLIGGLTETGWAVMALGAYGQRNSRVLPILQREQRSLADQSTTDIERQILALVAAGYDPRTFEGIDAIAILNSRISNNQFGSAQFLNDDIFGLIALRAAGQPLPGGVIHYVASQQQANGGWSLVVNGGTSSDMTALALIALRGTGVAPDAITKAQTYLRSLQNADGGFATQSGESNFGSTTWVRWFMNTYGLNWSKDGVTVDSFIANQQLANGSWFDSVLLTSYGLMALSHKPFPIIGTVQPTPTPTPSVTPSPSPSVTPTSSPTPTPTPTLSPSPSPSVTPTASPSSTPTLSPSPSPSPSPSLTPTVTPSSASLPTPPPSPKLAVVAVTYVAPKQQKQSYITPQLKSVSVASPTLNGMEHQNAPKSTDTLSATLAPATAEVQPVRDPLVLHLGFGVAILGLNIAATAYDFVAARKKRAGRL